MRSKNDWLDYLEHRLFLNNYLCHYGVLGMKWGIRRYQPYSTVPRKSGKGGKEIGSARQTKKQKIGMARYDMTGKYNHYKKDEFNVLTDYDSEASLKSIDSFPGRLRGEKEKAYLDATYPSSALKIKESIENGTENPYPREKGWDGLVNTVNPNYGERGTTNNCAYVAATMEVASRGYDVAARKAEGGCGTGIYEKWFDGAQTIDYREPFNDDSVQPAFDEAKRDMIKAGHGASGALITYYDGTNEPVDAEGNQAVGGHALHWRNDNGNIIVEDGQCHLTCSMDDVTKLYGTDGRYVSCVRLDNSKPNWDAMAEDGVFGPTDPDRRHYRAAESGYRESDWYYDSSSKENQEYYNSLVDEMRDLIKNK